MKIDPVDPDSWEAEIIFVSKVYYKKIKRRGTHLSLLNSGVTGPKFSKFLHDVARSSTLKLSKSELQYPTPFWNSKASNEAESADFANFDPKIGCYRLGNVPWAVRTTEQEAKLNARVADRTAPSHTSTITRYVFERSTRSVDKIKDRHTFGNWSGSRPGSWTPVLIG